MCPNVVLLDVVTKNARGQIWNRPSSYQYCFYYDIIDDIIMDVFVLWKKLLVEFVNKTDNNNDELFHVSIVVFVSKNFNYIERWFRLFQCNN